MIEKTRDQREYELVAMLLEQRQVLHSEYTAVTGSSPTSELTDRDIICAILRKEFPLPIMEQVQ